MAIAQHRGCGSAEPFANKSVTQALTGSSLDDFV